MSNTFTDKLVSLSDKLSILEDMPKDWYIAELGFKPWMKDHMGWYCRLQNSDGRTVYGEASNKYDAVTNAKFNIISQPKD